MKFGTKKKDAVEQSGNYLRGFKKGETKVRFLDEQDDWEAFREHYTVDRKGFPCTEDKTTCPGCTHPNETVSKTSRKYATQVLLVKQNQVLPFKIPITLSDRLAVRAERNGGTLVNRDYVILRSGDGFDTEYDVDQEDKYPVDLNDLRAKISVDIQDCFQDSFAEIWGDPDNPQLVLRPGPSEANNQSDVPPTKPSGASDAEAGVELTEIQVRAMAKPELRNLTEKAGLSWDEEDTTSELVERLLKAFAST